MSRRDNNTNTGPLGESSDSDYPLTVTTPKVNPAADKMSTFFTNVVFCGFAMIFLSLCAASAIKLFGLIT